MTALRFNRRNRWFRHAAVFFAGIFAGAGAVYGAFSSGLYRRFLNKDHAESNPRIEALGFEADTIRLLHAGGICTLFDLTRLTGLMICRMMIVREPGLDPCDAAQVDQGIQRFERLRSRLESLGYSLQGSRETLAVLYASFAPIMAR